MHIAKPRPNFSFEDKYKDAIVCGVDEVGRGPLAGPVVAAAVYIPQEKRGHPVWRDVRDSKQLSAVRRDILSAVIEQQSIWAVGEASIEEIDTLNILNATFLAMRRAIEKLPVANPVLLVDGNRLPKGNWPWRSETIVKGDSKSVSIAAASILAKVSRDRQMALLAAEFPAYGWNENAGYGTPAHMAALADFGATPHHRASFAPVRNVIIKKAG
jgi:ribonuclease HII